MKFGLCLLALALSGCGTTPNPASCLDNHCSDPERPFCDKDGAIGGEPNTCIAVACTPGEFEACRGDAALRCNATGDNFEQAECEFGCSDAGGGCNACNTSECERHIIPRYLPDVCNQLEQRDPVTLETQGINTGNDVNCSSVISQVDGPEICVYRASAITVPANNTLTFGGTRAIALVADRDVVIEGIVNVSGSSISDGPGGSYITSGGFASGPAAGGSGFRHPGGAGGSPTMDGGAMNGGAAAANPMTSTVLVGGRSAGHDPFGGYTAGGGGGALTIVSCRGTVRVTGLIDANGGGGTAAREIPFSIPLMYWPPSGGGTGGYVAIQGMGVKITGQLFANGGGGGSGQVGGASGEPGRREAGVALGGTPSNGKAGTGGNGGTGLTPPTAGTKPIMSTSTDFPGAGGGSAGFLQVYTPLDAAPEVTPSRASPALEAYPSLPTNR